MKFRFCFVIAAFLCSPLLFAGALLSLSGGGNKWGYSGGHAAAVQKWSGGEFLAEMELIRPAGDQSGWLPRESWFGFYVEDTGRSHRFSVGVFNSEWDASPKELPFSAVTYVKKGNYAVKKGEKKWRCSSDALKLRLEWKNGRLLLYAANGDAFEEVLAVDVPADFTPDRIGVTLDSYHTNGAIRNLTVNSFSVTGGGVTLQENFRESSDLEWTLQDAKRLVFEPPCRFGFEWQTPESGTNVFDRGTDGDFRFSARSTVLAGKDAEAEFRCYDDSGQELFAGTLPVALAASPTLHSFRIPGKLLDRNGIYRVKLKALRQDEVLGEAEQQFAVIPPREVVAGRYDVRSPYSTNYFADWKLAARLGAKKVRQTYWSLEDFEKNNYAPRAAENGLLINGLYLKGGFEESPAALRQKAVDVASLFLELKKRYPEVMYCQEFYNEPENWPPTRRETDLIPFAAVFRPIHEELRRAGSDLQLMSAGTTHVNLSFLKKLALLSGTDGVDIVAVHGYRSPARPEFGHEDEIAAIRDLFGAEKPIYVNEDAYFARTTPPKSVETSITQPFNGMIELDELTHGVYMQRKWLNQLMAGFSLVNQFDSIQNHSLSENEFHRRPGIVTFAALTEVLPHPVFRKRHTESTDHLWILEWENDGETVYTVWTLNDFHRVEFESASEIQVTNTYGNPVASGKRVSFVAGGAPSFLRGKNLRLTARKTTDELPSVVLPEELPLSGAPLGVAVYGGAKNTKESFIRIHLKNNTDQPYAGNISPRFMNDAPADWGFRPESHAVQLKPGETRVLEFATHGVNPYRPEAGIGYNALWWTEGYRVAVEADGKVIHHSLRPLCLRGAPSSDTIKIDGDFSDWDKVPAFESVGGARKRNIALNRFWTGEADYSVSCKFAWSREGLLFMAEVIDDKHDASQTGLNAWRTDSVQLGLNARHENPDYTDYAVITLSTGSPAILQRAMRNRKAGELSEVVLRHQRIAGDYGVAGRTLYECLIPWEILGVTPKEGTTLGFSVLFNESDGYWRKGWTGFYMQMGGQMIDPRLFGDLTLVR